MDVTYRWFVCDASPDPEVALPREAVEIKFGSATYRLVLDRHGRPIDQLVAPEEHLVVIGKILLGLFGKEGSSVLSSALRGPLYVAE